MNRGEVYNHHPSRLYRRAGYEFPPQQAVEVEVDETGRRSIEMIRWLEFTEEETPMEAYRESEREGEAE